MFSARIRDRLWHRWSVFWALPGLRRVEWPRHLRCDGYAPCGPDRQGWRTHLARYCVRMAAHPGMCLAPINSYGEEGDADFLPDAGGPQLLLARRYEQRLDFPPVRASDWRDDPCTVCGRSGTCNAIFCYHEEDTREDPSRGPR